MEGTSFWSFLSSSWKVFAADANNIAAFKCVQTCWEDMTLPPEELLIRRNDQLRKMLARVPVKGPNESDMAFLVRLGQRDANIKSLRGRVEELQIQVSPPPPVYGDRDFYRVDPFGWR